MIPRILEYEEGKVKVTAEAYGIPEINKIIQKYDYENCEAYLTYVAYLSYPDSPYINLPESERTESALFDVKEVFGEFDENDELIEPAVERLKSLWRSAATLAADEIEQEIHRWRIYLRDTPMGGDMKDRISITDKFEKLAISAANLRKIADDELGNRMKGNNELGEY